MFGLFHSRRSILETLKESDDEDREPPQQDGDESGGEYDDMPPLED